LQSRFSSTPCRTVVVRFAWPPNRVAILFSRFSFRSQPAPIDLGPRFIDHVPLSAAGSLFVEDQDDTGLFYSSKTGTLLFRVSHCLAV